MARSGAFVVVWTDSAWLDLEATADYIAKDSAYYAAAFVQEVKEAARSLEHFAKRGRTVPEINDSNVRELFIRNYRLIYQIDTSNVQILGFVHGSRDLWKLWE